MGGGFAGALFLINVALGVLKLFAVIDASVRPERFYRAAVPQSKRFWVTLLVVALVLSILTGPIGIIGIASVIAAVVYLVDVRPKLRAVQRGGPYGSW